VAERGELFASLSGRARHEAPNRAALPAVGDWVAIHISSASAQPTIQAVLPRRTSFSRKVAGERSAQQVVAANLELVFLVMGLDGDFNLRRLERYLTIAREGGVEPIIVLNKADLVADMARCVDVVASIAHGVPVHAVSAETGAGLVELERYLRTGVTIALLGSSGVGKSSLTNRFACAPIQQTNEVRVSDSRGRHTTTRRESILLRSGTLLIDTPGLRELQIWCAEDGLGEAFEDVTTLAASCRFRDCRHDGEPGCAVLSAAEVGLLDSGRLRNYLALRSEAESVERRRDALARRAEKARWKSITKSMRHHKKRG
jgi:ribosome biogenesis GTPase